MLAGLRGSGQEHSVTAQMLTASLGLWYLRSGRVAEAGGILASSIDYWEDRTIETDPWMQDLRAMSAVAQLMKLRESDRAGVGETTHGDRAAMASLEADLRVVADGYARANRNGPIPGLVRDALAKAATDERDILR